VRLLIFDCDLQVNPERRLGSGTHGAEEIKSHQWFSGFKWQDMEQREIQAPFLPTSPSPNNELGATAFQPIILEHEDDAHNRRDVFAEEWDHLWEWIDQPTESLELD
jgi:hypothetical protein